MLELRVVPEEQYDNETQTFFTPEPFDVEFEHSLVTLSKWEAKWEKPFLDGKPRSEAESYSYIEMMVVTRNFDFQNLRYLTKDAHEKITNYISAKHTATWFSEVGDNKPSTEIITTELIYYWMFSFSVDISAEHWHINRLLTLLKIFNLKQSPPKKMSRAEIAERNRMLNEQRRREMGTSG